MFNQENQFEKVFKMVVILSWPQLFNQNAATT